MTGSAGSWISGDGETGEVGLGMAEAVYDRGSVMMSLWIGR